MFEKKQVFYITIIEIIVNVPIFVKLLLNYPIRNDLRRRLAGNLTGKSSDAHSVMDSSPLLRCRLDLPATLLRDPSTGREQTTLNAVSLVARRIAYARFAFRKTKSDKITFSKSNFLPLKKIEKQAFR